MILIFRLNFAEKSLLYQDMAYLEKVIQALHRPLLQNEAEFPSLWMHCRPGKPTRMDYAEYVLNRIAAIREDQNFHKSKGDKSWSKKAVIYNMFVRFCTAYDHNADQQLGGHSTDTTVNDAGIRETGTFLKSIALIPYLQHLGVNTIHLLPITVIGKIGRKGDLGSPYAIKNPYTIDPLLKDPVIGLSVEDQYKAFVEAAHLAGIRVVQEFIFRTASMDADWTTSNPEWFYWIKKGAKNGPPSFAESTLKEIKRVPEGKGVYHPPSLPYRNKYVIPDREKLSDAKVASAFADWPPDDLQPPWTDVTYLRLYNYDFSKANNYNYIAYNTIRYYDPELAQDKNINHPLWEKITAIIPYFQKQFKIDGAMIDMGHALPDQLKKNIIKTARENDPTFSFWDENFDNTIATKKEGYNAVIGDAWYAITKRNGFKNIIPKSAKEKPLPFFGAAETHNSPRYGVDASAKKKAAWLLFNLLPNAIPFLHNGFELNESLPVNTGLNFSQKQLDDLADKQLPLFFKQSLDWNTTSSIPAFANEVARVRKAHPWIFTASKINVVYTGNRKVLGLSLTKGSMKALALFNTDFHKPQSFSFEIGVEEKYESVLEDFTLTSRNNFKRGQALLFIVQRG